MNLYLLSIFVVLCFGPWTIAREVYQRIPKTSAEATTKNLTAEGRSHIINGLVQVASQAHTWIQWLRRLLKALRKWCTSHPFEVKLGKCVAGYFGIRIPGPRHPVGKLDRYDGNPSGMESPEKIPRETMVKRRGDAPARRRIFADGLPDKHFVFAYLRDTFIKIGDGFRVYRDVIFRDNLAVCMWDYFWKKLWAWVDSAPDSR